MTLIKNNCPQRKATMANKKTAVKINPEKIKKELEKSGISINQLAKELEMTDRNLRRSINEKNELQHDQIERIAALTKTDPSEFIDPFITITASKDVYDHRGKLRLKKGDSIRLPKIGSDNYSKADLKEWNNAIDECLYFFGIGERLHNMKRQERENFCSFVASWIMLANKYYGSLNKDQEVMLLETCEALADKMVEKNSQK